MHICHGGLVVDVPESWADRSTLLFVAPQEDNRLPTAQPVEQSTEAVSINFVRDVEGDASAVLHDQIERLRAVDPEFQMLHEEPFTCGLGTGWQITQRLHLAGVAVRQLVAACVVGRICIVATASATDERFSQHEPRLRAILQSLSIHSKQG